MIITTIIIEEQNDRVQVGVHRVAHSITHATRNEEKMEAVIRKALDLRILAEAKNWEGVDKVEYDQGGAT